MRFTIRHSVRCLCLIALPVLSATATLAQEPRVLIALDSSRSLSPEQSRAASELARALLVRLATTTSTSVLTFDDSVHWLARLGEGGADAALQALRPTGRFTVLNDGLIEGTRSLEGGGVLVLLSDGKDENSATTIEDVARLASERDVRVVTLGVGRVDERTMKRLALLTDGLYAGLAGGIDPDALTAEIEALRRQVEAEMAPPAAAPPPPVDTPVTAPPPPLEEPAGSDSPPLLLVGALVAAVGIVIGFLLARRRTSAGPAPVESVEIDTKPGVPLPVTPPPYASADAVQGVDEIQVARLRGWSPVPAGGLMEVSLDDAAAFQSLPFSESIERTLVLNEEIVLTVREPGKEARNYRMPPGRAIDIGRDAARNSLAFHDPTMSVQHLRLALEEGEVFLVDLSSTNGVVVRERRVDSALLHPGDRFRAGMIEFELNLHRASMA